jgi:hypothetical protein
VYVLQVLLAIGLKSEVDHTTFIKCASEVGSWDLTEMSAQQRHACIDVSRALVQELISNTALHSSALFSSLRDLAFVPAVRVSAGIGLLHVAV